MAKFFYKMQNILNVKEKLETQAENEFALAAASLREEEEKLWSLISRKNEYENQLTCLYSSVLNVDDIRDTLNSIELMKYQIDIQNGNVEKAERVLDLARYKLQEAIKDKKTHERLKEKAFDEFKAELLKEESKEIDELVSYRFGQKE